MGYPCADVSTFNKLYQELKETYRDANHITYAYHINETGTVKIRFSDDGEPSGTAGKPILNHIEGNNLINTVIFVIRYFGGVKLGTGGLIRAYGNGAREVLLQGKLKAYIEQETLQFVIGYDQLKHLEYCLYKKEGTFLSKEFGEKLECTIQIPKTHRLDFLDLLGFQPENVENIN